MLKIAITIEPFGQRPGKVIAPFKVSSDYSEDLSRMEIEVMWKTIKSGDFEGMAKNVLKEICTKHGFDAAQLLPD